jgi:hypothetical protein
MKPSTLSLTYLKCLNYLTCLLRRWRRRSPMTSHPSDSTASVTYCFRIRCTLGATVTVASDDPHWVLATSDTHREDVVLAPAEGTTLGGTRHLVARGSSFDSPDAAFAAGQRWMSKIQLAFARMRVGADFGERGIPGGTWTEFGLRTLEEQHGGRILNDVMGLSVFECEPAPMFVRMGPPTVSVGKAGVLGALRAAAANDVSMPPQEQLAYALYSASFNETHADARFVMLMMALETLLPETERPEAVLAHVERLREITKQADLPDADRRSLLGSLDWLRLQSINLAASSRSSPTISTYIPRVSVMLGVGSRSAHRLPGPATAH